MKKRKLKMLLKFLVFIFVTPNLILCEDDFCTKETCQDPFAYPKDLDWDAKSGITDIWSWIKGQLRKDVVTFCKETPRENDQKANQPFRLVIKEDPCTSGRSNTIFKGKQGRDGLPDKQGILQLSTEGNQFSKGACVKLAQGVRSVSSSFQSGLPKGRATINFVNGESIEGTFVNGALEGKVRHFATNGKLHYIGHYSRGRPHGPIWILPWSTDDEGITLVHYDNGKVDTRFDVVYVDQQSSQRGRLVNETYIENPKMITITRTADFACLKVPDLETNGPKSGQDVYRLPVKVPTEMTSDARLFIRSSKILFFNRIAKTGSQAFIAFFYKMESKLKYKVKLEMLQTEHLIEPPEGVTNTVEKVTASLEPSVWIRHYNFVDFPKYGAKNNWNPDWFNVVRDPIERVVSWFYYWRSAWNIVERKLQYPDDPLPDPQSLRMDFDTCVLENNPECQFIQNSNVLEYTDHRSQMMAFCGQDLSCASFNSEEVLQRAKENVERFYPVVGVLENLNMSLAVMEDRLPQFFKGATQLYHEAKEVKKFRNRNAFKVPVSDEVLKIVRANFTREIEFYEFCRQRLDMQFLKLKNNK